MDEYYTVSVQNLVKAYKLYDSDIDRLKESLHPLRKKYSRDFYALNDVTFRLKRGETLGVIGRNGSGKSTLLKMIAGVLTPTSGSIEVNGTVSALLELGAGFNPELTGIENIYFSGTIMGFTKAQMDRKVAEILSFADIGKFVHQPVKTYSNGMFVRLAFAVAVMIDPDLLIVDEALAVGDMRFSMKCLRKMKDLIARGASVIFVSHDMGSVMNFCREVIWLHDGKVFQQGNPKRITTNYANYMTYGFLPPEMSTQEQMPDQGDGDYRPTSLICGAGDAPEVGPGDRLAKLSWTELGDLPSIGEGGATILRVAIGSVDEEGSRAVFSGGEECEVFLDLQANQHLPSPSVCADFRDRRGNLIFGLNTHFVGPGLPEMGAGSRIMVHFKFRVPLLLIGEYSMAVAVSDGSYEAHVQHHIVMDALVINITSTDLPRRHYLSALESCDCFVYDVNPQPVREN